jgi:hypothetical protein
MLRKIRFNIPLLFIWIGAFLFWVITFGESHFDTQLIDKYKTRNIITGITFLLLGILIIFYSIIK